MSIRRDSQRDVLALCHLLRYFVPPILTCRHQNNLKIVYIVELFICS